MYKKILSFAILAMFVFSSTANGDVSVKPVVQMVFEQLYDAGLREFCFVVGRGKGNVTNHKSFLFFIHMSPQLFALFLLSQKSFLTMAPWILPLNPTF